MRKSLISATLIVAAGLGAENALAQAPKLEFTLKPARVLRQNENPVNPIVYVSITIPNGDLTQTLEASVPITPNERGPENLTAKRDKLLNALDAARTAWNANQNNANNRIEWNVMGLNNDGIRTIDLPVGASRGGFGRLDSRNTGEYDGNGEDLTVTGCPSGLRPKGKISYDNPSFDRYDSDSTPFEWQGGFTFNGFTYRSTVLGSDSRLGAGSQVDGSVIAGIIASDLTPLVQPFGSLIHVTGSRYIDFEFNAPGEAGSAGLIFGTSVPMEGVSGEVYDFVPEPSSLVLLALGALLGTRSRTMA
ncbi:hypothetical protein RAS1_01820 [Phycisphaerae bacterium RAS1]|nr:hypothetical protein RAS1_01820 [Phycisphaerae bacterium RAS1]